MRIHSQENQIENLLLAEYFVHILYFPVPYQTLPDPYILVILHIMLGPSNSHFCFICTKDKSVSPAIMSNNVYQALKTPWISRQHIRIISNTDNRYTDWSNKEAQLGGVCSSEAWVNVRFEMSCSSFMSLSRASKLMNFSTEFTILFHFTDCILVSVPAVL